LGKGISFIFYFQAQKVFDGGRLLGFLFIFLRRLAGHGPLTNKALTKRAIRASGFQWVARCCSPENSG
jgi:hypothetical protein